MSFQGVIQILQHCGKELTTLGILCSHLTSQVLSEILQQCGAKLNALELADNKDLTDFYLTVGHLKIQITFLNHLCYFIDIFTNSTFSEL